MASYPLMLLCRASSSFSSVPGLASRSLETLFHGLSSLRIFHHGVASIAMNNNALERRSADEHLIRLVESEIHLATIYHGRISVPLPKWSEICFHVSSDRRYERTFVYEYWSYKLMCERVNAKVDIANISSKDAENDREGVVSHASSFPFVVSVHKRSSGACLEFGVTAYPDKISIDRLSLTRPLHVAQNQKQPAYEGPRFSELDENMQKAFLKYLEVRVIKPTSANELYDKAVEKETREYLEWLKDLKNFLTE